MDLTANKNVWNNCSEEEKERFADAVFKHCRALGFPYFPSGHEFGKAELGKFADFPYMKLLMDKT